jgi:hypothetical protein
LFHTLTVVGRGQLDVGREDERDMRDLANLKVRIDSLGVALKPRLGTIPFMIMNALAFQVTGRERGVCRAMSDAAKSVAIPAILRALFGGAQ